MNGDTNKIQWSKFSPDRSEQYVIRTNDWEEMKTLRDKVIGIIPKSKPFPDDEGPSATPPEDVQQTVPMCVVHNVQMKVRNGPTGKFYSHAKKEGQEWVYCSGKGWK